MLLVRPKLFFGDFKVYFSRRKVVNRMRRIEIIKNF